MRLISCLIAAWLLLCANLCIASGSNDITMKDQHGKKGIIPITDQTETLGDVYPLVGIDHTSPYYLDTDSCVYDISGGTATLECIIYGFSADGEIYMLTHVFDTYKLDGKRIIILKKVIAQTGHDITKNRLKWDNGFAKQLFWKAAEYSGLAVDLN